MFNENKSVYYNPETGVSPSSSSNENSHTLPITTLDSTSPLKKIGTIDPSLISGVDRVPQPSDTITLFGITLTYVQILIIFVIIIFIAYIFLRGK